MEKVCLWTGVGGDCTRLQCICVYVLCMAGLLRLLRARMRLRFLSSYISHRQAETAGLPTVSSAVHLATGGRCVSASRQCLAHLAHALELTRPCSLTFQQRQAGQTVCLLMVGIARVAGLVECALLIRRGTELRLGVGRGQRDGLVARGLHDGCGLTERVAGSRSRLSERLFLSGGELEGRGGGGREG